MDPISDFIIALNNAGKAGHKTVLIPHSKIKEAICNVLVKEGFIQSVTKKGKKVKSLELELVYVNGKPRVKGVKRISHLSKRIYKGVKSLRPVKNHFGKLILTTPKGIMTDEMAKKERVGGEALFEIW